MKRIAMVFTFFPLSKKVDGLGGAERRIFSIFTSINNTNLAVTVILVVGENKQSVLDLLEKYNYQKAKILTVDSGAQLISHLLQQKYDFVCYTDSIIRSIPTIIGSMLAKSKRVVLIESLYRAYGYYRSFQEWMGINFVFRTATHLDTLYPASKKRIDIKYPKRNPTSVVPCALPRMDKFINSEKKENLIVFAGRLTDSKNPLLFVDTMISCQKSLRENNYKCMVCGIGECFEEIKSRIYEAKCEDFITMSGYVNMEDIFSKTKIFCSLQRKENYPSQSLLEAILSGCFCIATDVGDTNKIIKPSYGQLVEANVESMKEAIALAMDFDDSKWMTIRKEGEAFAKANFAIDNSVSHYERLFVNY